MDFRPCRIIALAELKKITCASARLPPPWKSKRCVRRRITFFLVSSSMHFTALFIKTNEFNSITNFGTEKASWETRIPRPIRKPIRHPETIERTNTNWFSPSRFESAYTYYILLKYYVPNREGRIQVGLWHWKIRLKDKENNDWSRNIIATSLRGMFSVKFTTVKVSLLLRH